MNSTFFKIALMKIAVLCLMTGCVAKADPWYREAKKLMRLNEALQAFNDTERSEMWQYSDLTAFLLNQKNIDCGFFVKPTTGAIMPWILLEHPPGAKGVIVAACPILGGKRAEHESKRLVVYFSGDTEWIDEQDFNVQLSNAKRVIGID